MDFMRSIGNCIHTDENLCEFLGILNDSKNFKVIVNLGTFGLFLGKTCSNVMKMLSLKILTIIYKKKKVFLTFTSFYIQNFLRVKSLKNNNLTINE